MATTEELNAAKRRLIPVPTGMCPAFYKFMGAGCVRSDSGEILMLADDCGEQDRTKAEELNAAVDDLRADNYGLSRHDAADKEADQALLAEAYLAHISEQERIAAERALPVTEEWLLEIGFTPSKQFSGVVELVDPDELSPRVLRGIDCNSESDSGWIWDIANVRRDGSYDAVESVLIANNLATRGEVLDLLAALKIPTKGA